MAGKVHCNGVGDFLHRQQAPGYHVSMVFTGLSKQAEARLSAMAVLRR